MRDSSRPRLLLLTVCVDLAWVTVDDHTYIEQLALPLWQRTREIISTIT